MDDPLVRPAGPEEAEDAAAVHIRSWQAAYRGLLPDAVLDDLSVERRAEMWRAQLSGASDTRMWVAEAAEGVVGFVAVGPEHPPEKEGTAEVYAIYLAPDRFRTELGTTLLHRAVAELRAAGFQQAVLWILDRNEGARRFYEARGWRADGATKVEVREGLELSEVRYRIEL